MGAAGGALKEIKKCQGGRRKTRSGGLYREIKGRRRELSVMLKVHERSRR